MNTSSEHIKKVECELCDDKAYGKKHKSTYTDGHTYCHRCKTYIPGEGSGFVNLKTGEKLEIDKYTSTEQFIGTISDIPERGLSVKTCELLGIMNGRIYNKNGCYLYMYDNGLKVRLPDKSFPWIEGSAKECSMFGLDQAKDYTKPIIITEGEFDTAACYEVGYQACSLHSGNGSAKISAEHDKQELLKYKEIWIGVDNDEAGRKAKEDLIEVFREWNILERVSIIDWWPKKDANEVLMLRVTDEEGCATDNFEQDKEQLLDYLKENVTQWSPEGITLASDIDIEDLKITNIRTLKIPLPKLQASMGGFDYGCNYGVLAGVGIGKTTFLSWMNLELFLNNPELKIASLFYEEGEAVTPLRYISLQHKIPIGKLRRDRTLLNTKQWEEAKVFYNSDRMAFLNKKSDKTSKGLIQYMTWLVKVRGFDMIVIDHISYIIGRSGVSKNGERRDIDELIYQIQDLTNSLGCITIFVSHITESKDTKKNWDDGEVPSLYSGRGSRALAQIPDGIIGIARNMKNAYNQSIADVYNLKNRWDGTLGKMDSLLYYEDSGTLEIYNK